MGFEPGGALRDRYHVSDDQKEQLFSYVRLVQTAPMNLTAWSWDDIWRRGVFDALDIALRMPHGSGRALDIGSGAGFPGMVLAMVRPSWQWTLLDSRIRRVEFLEKTAQTLRLGNVRAVAARAEEWVSGQPDEARSYHLVTLRAVAPLGVSIELGLPFAALGSTVWVAQGPGGEAAVGALAPFIGQLGGQSGEVIDHGEGRLSVAIIKQRETPPEYPRRGKALGRARGLATGLPNGRKPPPD